MEEEVKGRREGKEGVRRRGRDGGGSERERERERWRRE